MHTGMTDHVCVCGSGHYRLDNLYCIWIGEVYIYNMNVTVLYVFLLLEQTRVSIVILRIGCPICHSQKDGPSELQSLF